MALSLKLHTMEVVKFYYMELWIGDLNIMHILNKFIETMFGLWHTDMCSLYLFRCVDICLFISIFEGIFFRRVCLQFSLGI